MEEHMAELLTLEEAADYLRKPVDTLRYWRKLGRGPKAAKVGRTLLYRKAEIDRWVQEQEAASRAG
jgi:excisionase family DNA binding protein